MNRLVALALLAALALPLLPVPLAPEAAATTPAPFPAPGDRFVHKSAGADHARQETETWVTASEAAARDPRLAPHVADGLIGRIREGSRSTTNSGAYWTSETWTEIALVRASDRELVAETRANSYVLRSDGQTYTSSEIITYSSCPQQRWPLAVGDEWGHKCPGSGTTDSGGKFTVESPATWRVASRETVTVGGRAFEAYKVEQRYADGTLIETSWFAPAACAAVKSTRPFAPGADFQNELEEAKCAATAFSHAPKGPNAPPSITCSWVFVRPDVAWVSWNVTDPDGDVFYVRVTGPYAQADFWVASHQPPSVVDKPFDDTSGEGPIVVTAWDVKDGEAEKTCTRRENLAPVVFCHASTIGGISYSVTWTVRDPDGDPVEAKLYDANGEDIDLPSAGGTAEVPAGWSAVGLNVEAFDLPYRQRGADSCLPPDELTLDDSVSKAWSGVADGLKPVTGVETQIPLDPLSGAIAGAGARKCVVEQSLDGEAFAPIGELAGPSCGGAIPWTPPDGVDSVELRALIEGDAGFRTPAFPVDIEPLNTPPTVTITDPADDARFTEGLTSSLEVRYTVVDAQNNVVSVAVERAPSADGPWDSNRLDRDVEGGRALFFGRPSPSDPDPVGEYFVRVTATDAGGLTGSDVVRFVIEIRKRDLMDAFDFEAAGLQAVASVTALTAAALLARRR